MRLLPPEKVRKLQKTLNAKAKGSPAYRFLVDKKNEIMHDYEKEILLIRGFFYYN